MDGVKEILNALLDAHKLLCEDCECPILGDAVLKAHGIISEAVLLDPVFPTSGAANRIQVFMKYMKLTGEDFTNLVGE